MNRLKRDRATHARRGPFFWVLLALVIFMLYNTASAWRRQFDSLRERQALQQKIDDREREIAELKNTLERLASGEGLELEARSRLNLQKPDERVLIITGEPENGSTKKGQASDTYWARVKKWFMSLL